MTASSHPRRLICYPEHFPKKLHNNPTKQTISSSGSSTGNLTLKTIAGNITLQLQKRCSTVEITQRIPKAFSRCNARYGKAAKSSYLCDPSGSKSASLDDFLAQKREREKKMNTTQNGNEYLWLFGAETQSATAES